MAPDSVSSKKLAPQRHHIRSKVVNLLWQLNLSLGRYITHLTKSFGVALQVLHVGRVGKVLNSEACHLVSNSIPIFDFFFFQPLFSEIFNFSPLFLDFWNFNHYFQKFLLFQPLFLDFWNFNHYFQNFFISPSFPGLLKFQPLFSEFLVQHLLLP